MEYRVTLFLVSVPCRAFFCVKVSSGAVATQDQTVAIRSEVRKIDITKSIFRILPPNPQRISY